MASSTSQTSRPNGDLVLYRSVLTKMTKHPEICFLIIAVCCSIFTKIGVSFHTKQITEAAKSPWRFFPVGSAVIDFHYGNLVPIAELIQKEELVFVMYYAPWCAKSMQIRNEFQKAAKIMQHRVRFVAVNCWWASGECRSQYKFLMFPELFLYHTYIGGFRYTGVISADYIVRFLEDMIYPVTFLHTEDEIREFVARHDTSVIGYFDFHASPQPPGYTQFYYASLRMIELDHLQHVEFAAVAQKKLALELNLTYTDSLIMFRRSNYTMKYPIKNNFTSSSIQRWVMLNQDKLLVKFLSPPGHKNLHLSNAINKGPAVLVFIPVNRLHSACYYYNLVREVALQYSHCNNQSSLEDLVGISVKDRQRVVLDHHQQQLSCQPNNTAYSFDKNCCVSIVTSQNDHKICEYCKHIHSPKLSPCIFSTSPHIAQELTFGSVQTSTCIESVQNYNVNEHRSLCCKNCDSDLLRNHKCASRRTKDLFVFNSVHFYRNYICKKLTLQKLQRLVLPHEFINHSGMEKLPSSFIASKCSSNKTVNFYVLDTLHHGIFADRISPGLTKTKVPTVILIDKQNEALHVLRERFSQSSLANFVMNFTSSLLPRHLRSETKVSICDSVKGDNICIADVTSESFHSIVMDNSKDVVLFVYAPWCGFCAGIAHLYMSLAKYFKTAKSIIFTRINADGNDLPWEFTVEKYPTILFFPANRKADSVMFPETVPKTLPNLIKFVMNHATHDLRMDTAVDVCSKSCKKSNLENSIYLIHSLRRRVMVIRQRIKHLSVALSDDDEAKEMQNLRKKNSLTILTLRLRKLEIQLQYATLLKQYLIKHHRENFTKEDFSRFLNQHKMKSDRSASHKLHDEL